MRLVVIEVYYYILVKFWIVNYRVSLIFETQMSKGLSSEDLKG